MKKMKRLASKVIAFMIAFTMVATLIPVLPTSAASKFEVGLHGNGGQMKITYKGETFAYTPEMSETGGVEGLCLRDLGYTNVELKHEPVYVFKGWYPYVGGKKVDGAKLLTTDEMLDYKFPNKEIWFYAQWQERVEGDTYIGIHGNGSKFQFTFDGETVTTEGCGYGTAVQGSTLRETGYTYVSTPIHHNGNTFMGWHPMQPTGNEDDDKAWTIIENAKLLTTDEMLDYVIPENDITFYAKWDGLALPGEKSIEANVQGRGGVMDVILTGENFTSDGFGKGGAVPGSTLRKLGYTYISTPVHPEGKKFEGWCAAASLGPNNGWKVIPDAEFLTTEEMMNYPFTEMGIMFLAQWEGVVIEDIFGVVNGLTVDIQGDGGEFQVDDVRSEDTSWITIGNCTEGSTIRGKKHDIKDPVHPQGYKFLGWCLYERNGFFYNKTDKVLTTEQVLDYKLPAGGVMFVAKWYGQQMMEEYGGFSCGVNANGGEVAYSSDIDSAQRTDTEVITGGFRNGSKLGNIFDIKDPVHPRNKVFEGWGVYKEIPGVYRSFKKADGHPLLTTSEMLDYACVDSGLLFVAKWNDRELPEYWGNNDWFNVTMDGNGGTAVYTTTDSWSTIGCGRGDAKEGMTVKDIGYTRISTPIHPSGKKFKGWSLYKKVNDDYVEVKGYENMTTEEMLNYKLKDYSVMFMAQWGCDHSYKTTKTVKATTSKNGYIQQKCSKCKEYNKTTLYKVGSVKCNTAKYTYNGKAKKPSVTVKDSKGNTISSKYYTVSYAKGRKAVGRYKVAVKFKTRYSGTKTAYFTIVPKAPSSASAALYGYDDVKFSWKKSKGAKGYSVYYKTATGSYKLLTRTTKTSAKKANLSDGIKHTFKVVPYYKSGSTRYDALTSKTASVYTLKKMATPTVEKYNNSQVKVKWTDIDGQSGYQISKSTSKTKTKIVSTYATTSRTSKTLKATKGKAYYYKVRAYKTVGKTKIYGPWSTAVQYKLEPVAQQ